MKAAEIVEPFKGGSRKREVQSVADAEIDVQMRSSSSCACRFDGPRGEIDSAYSVAVPSQEETVGTGTAADVENLRSTGKPTFPNGGADERRG
jgi:hypothetical protein